ncbi:MAG: hypothetical protein GY711_14540 [bacterium]|nr:hypothetical protein [bacterium]
MLQPIGLLLLAPPVLAQVQEGDLLVHTGPPEEIRHFQPDGTLVAQTATDGANRWTGATLTRGGLWAAAHELPATGVKLFDATGVELLDFPTPEVLLPGEVNEFSDGTLAVLDRMEDNVDYYTPQGVHIGFVDLPNQTEFVAGAIDANDELWLANRAGSTIWRVHRDGSLLDVFTAGNTPWDVVVADDGTLWTMGRASVTSMEGRVRHYTPDGTLLSAFDLPFLASGIGLAPDGTLWLSNASTILNFTPSGTQIGQFSAGNAVQLFTVARGTLGSRYCSPANANSSGVPARITAEGSLSVVANDLMLLAEDVPVGEFGYFLVGSNQGQAQPPGSQGVLCLTCGFQGCSGIGRYTTNIFQGPVGTLAVDLTALPLSPPQPVLPGETWNFQAWFRDLGSNNFTDAVSLTFL